MNKAQYRAAFVASLQQFPLYQSSHHVQVAPLDEGRWYLGYAGIDADRYWKLHPMLRQESTHLDLNITPEGKENICDVIMLYIDSHFRRKAQRTNGPKLFGTKLLACVEDFAKKVGCGVVRGKPSGNAAKMEFYERRGYEKASKAFKRQCPTTGDSLIKRL